VAEQRVALPDRPDFLPALAQPAGDRSLNLRRRLPHELHEQNAQQGAECRRPEQQGKVAGKGQRKIGGERPVDQPAGGQRQQPPQRQPPAIEQAAHPRRDGLADHLIECHACHAPQQRIDQQEGEQHGDQRGGIGQEGSAQHQHQPDRHPEHAHDAVEGQDARQALDRPADSQLRQHEAATPQGHRHPQNHGVVRELGEKDGEHQARADQRVNGPEGDAVQDHQGEVPAQVRPGRPSVVHLLSLPGRSVTRSERHSGSRRQV